MSKKTELTEQHRKGKLKIPYAAIALVLRNESTNIRKGNPKLASYLKHWAQRLER